MDYQRLMLTTSTTTLTMTGMALDSIQQTNRTTLNTSLGTKIIWKSRFLDVFSLKTNSNDPTPPIMTPLVKCGFFNDTLHEEELPSKPPSPFPSPQLIPNAPYPSAESIAGATARLKSLFNRPPIQKRILLRYFFQAYAKLIMTNKQVIMTLYNLQSKAQRQEIEKFYCMQIVFGTVKQPTETQCTSLVFKPALYQTSWDITSETIRVFQEAYEAYSLVD